MSLSYTQGPLGQYQGYAMADPTAVIGRRVAAKIIDSLVGVPIIAFVIWWMFHSAVHVPSLDPVSYCNTFFEVNKICIPYDDEALVLTTSPLVIYGGGALTWFTMVILEAYFGWTPGKLAMGLRVVRQDNGQNIGFGKALIRALLWFVDGFCGGIVGFMVAQRSPGHRRLGDQAASTLVVRKESAGQPLAIPGLTSRPIGPLQPGAGAAAPWSPGFPSPGGPVTSGDTSQFTADVPIWDEARRAYIQYDTERGAWLEYDQATAAWKPIST